MSNGKAVENLNSQNGEEEKRVKSLRGLSLIENLKKGEVIPFTDLTRIRRRYTLKEIEERGYRFGALRIYRAWKIRARLLSSILR